jgi:hypothetical protein
MNYTIISIAMATMMFIACSDKKPSEIQGNPRDVAEAIFNAAKSGNTEGLAALIDVDADNDSRMIAQAARDKTILEEFRKYFAKGRVKDEPVINGEKASVNILFGPDGTHEEKFEMVKREGKWYLVSF